MTVMTKNEFAKAYADEYGTTVKEATETLHQVFSLVKDILVEDKLGVKLGDIGTLVVDVKPERQHINPQNQEKVIKPAHYAAKFKVNSALKKVLVEQELEG